MILVTGASAAVRSRLGKRRLLVGLPVRVPRLSAAWCALVASVPRSVAEQLILGLSHPSVVTDDSALGAVPEIRPMGLEEALRRAMEGA